jgi:hypothetical protein
MSFGGRTAANPAESASHAAGEAPRRDRRRWSTGIGPCPDSARALPVADPDHKHDADGRHEAERRHRPHDADRKLPVGKHAQHAGGGLAVSGNLYRLGHAGDTGDDPDRPYAQGDDRPQSAVCLQSATGTESNSASRPRPTDDLTVPLGAGGPSRAPATRPGAVQLADQAGTRIHNPDASPVVSIQTAGNGTITNGA